METEPLGHDLEHEDEVTKTVDIIIEASDLAIHAILHKIHDQEMET